jgi:DNA-binding NtrC family response regulator
VLLDVRFGEDEKFGFTLLRALREDSRFGKDLPVVMLTSEGKGKKDEADKLNADGFFPKADEKGNALWSEAGLKDKVLRYGLIFDDRDDSLLAATHTTRLIGYSLPLLHLLRDARKCGLEAGDRILYGETGSGKTELAGYIHCFAERQGPYRHWIADQPNPQLMKTKLFGWWKNAFDGARIPEPGEIEKSHDGTFFLDEVSNLPPEIQTTLLQVRKQDERGWRILEREGKFPASPADQAKAKQSVVEGADILPDSRIRVNVYLITGTRDNLEDPAIREKKHFRDDLHNALGSPMFCPSLNERRVDIPELFEAFVRRELNRPGRPAREFQVEAAVLELLQARDWSQRGNIRDLERIAKDAAQQLGDFRTVRLDRLPSDVLKDADGKHAKSSVESVKNVEASVVPVTIDSPAATAENLSSAPGSLTRAELEHLRRRASLLEEAAEATRKVDAATGTKGRYQPQVAVTRLMGNSVTGSNAQRIIRTDIIGPILKPKKKMTQAYGEKEILSLQEWVKSRPVLMSLYRYSIKEIDADEIHKFV